MCESEMGGDMCLRDWCWYVREMGVDMCAIGVDV